MTLSSDAEVPLTIAIDGPAASGKSTIAALLAEKLGYVYLDTGVMYRAVTWEALQRHIPISDEGAITRLSETLHIKVTQPTENDGRQYTVYADGKDVTWELRRPEVNAHVSPVSAYPGVRRALVAQQQRIGHCGRIVMVGRDIGTVVLPEADLKIYLEAVVDERARRRYCQVLQQRGQEGDHQDRDKEYEDIREAMIRRDRIDSGRKVSPLRPAEDAVVIDTTDMTVRQVLDRVLELIGAWPKTVEGGFVVGDSSP
jgi:cytidylate kinase